MAEPATQCPPDSTAPERIVLLHGLYLSGRWLGYLARRLLQAGFAPMPYSYASVRQTPAEAAADLANWLPERSTGRVHFVAHSLGGLVVRHLFGGEYRVPDGRVVTLGTPHQGSHVAAWLSGHGFGPMLGGARRAGLLGGLPDWPPDRQLGCIAGTMGLGIGRLFPGLPDPNDGTVAVLETRLRGMSDHITLPVTHTGMLMSQRVADQTTQFLRQGCFRHHAVK